VAWLWSSNGGDRGVDTTTAAWMGRGGDSFEAEDGSMMDGSFISELEDWIGGGSCWRIAGDHGHAHGSRRSDLTNYLGANPGGSLGAAGLLVEPMLPDGQDAKLLHPLLDALSTKQAC